jgi:hypothetical protein
MFEISPNRRLLYFLFRMMVRFSANVALRRYLVQIAWLLFHRGKVNTVHTCSCCLHTILLTWNHGLMNFIDTKAKCRHLINWPGLGGRRDQPENGMVRYALISLRIADDTLNFKPNLHFLIFFFVLPAVLQNILNIWARICKRLRSPGIDVAWRAGTSNRVVVPAHQAKNRFLGSLKRFTNLGSVSIGHGDIADFCCGASQLSGLNSGPKRPGSG